MTDFLFYLIFAADGRMSDPPVPSRGMQASFALDGRLPGHPLPAVNNPFWFFMIACLVLLAPLPAYKMFVRFIHRLDFVGKSESIIKLFCS